MATYGLKYKAEFQNTKGQYFRIRIYQRGYSGGSTTIGTLAGCVLEVQGNMGSVIAPIIKTQLRVSMVDAPDIPSAGTGKKFGNWQEFFTPDATLYKVVLGQSTNSGSSYTDIWSGYITPDSWVESLEYRGTITITARDGIGHLQDFQFSASDLYPDENGLDMITNIIYKAMQVIDFPMDFTSDGARVPMTEDGNQVDNAYVNVSLFEGMNWYEVLERTLEAIGFVFRYVGGNKCVFSSLAQIPKLGVDGTPGTQALEFYGGTLEFDPAVKKIEEEQDYKQQNEVAFELFEGLTFNATATYRCKTDGNTLPGGGVVHVPEHDADMNTVAGKGRTGWDIGSGMLDPSLYLPDDFLKRAEGEDGWRNYPMIAGNQVLNGSSPTATFRFKTRTAAVKLLFRFTETALTINDSGSMIGKMAEDRYSLNNIKYYVMYSDGTTTRYWNGYSWRSSAELLEAQFDSSDFFVLNTDLEIVLGECADITEGGEIAIMFGQVTYKMWDSGGHGCYARLQSLTAELTATTALQSNKVTTINNNDYNVKLSRKPLFGAMSKEVGFVRPANYLAGLFYYPVFQGNPQAYPYGVKFSGQSATVPLPVLIHEQILCYYYGAARVLNGSAAVVGNALFAFNKVNTYKGHTYLFQGGTLDLFSGIINNAVFREYMDYDELWSGEAPTYDDETIYNN